MHGEFNFPDIDCGQPSPKNLAVKNAHQVQVVEKPSVTSSE